MLLISNAMLTKLKKICEESLENNCVKTPVGQMIAAGGHQFKTLWTRDFCFSVPGLLLNGKKDLVTRQLDLIIANLKSPDHLLPRGIDVVSPKIRVALNTVGRFLPEHLKNINYEKPLYPEYLGEHNTPAADSNLLVLLACTQLAKKNPKWFDLNKNNYFKIFSYYDSHVQDGFVTQLAFSDWQDSAKREGVLFYLNLLYLMALDSFQNLGFKLLPNADIEAFRNKVFYKFYDKESGLFRNRPNGNQFSLETQLFAIETDIFLNLVPKEKIYSSLKGHPLWNHDVIPGIAIYPPYASSEISWSTRLVGLRGYHDYFHWSWLLGESAKIAFLMNDPVEGLRILKQIETSALHHNTIHEIYHYKNNELIPYTSIAYTSESPFTWGAAKILEAIYLAVDKY